MEKGLHMEEVSIVFEGFLRQKSLKLTRPRRLILEAVFATHKHFSAESLFADIRKDHPGVSLTTVYRTLPLLVEAGLVHPALRTADSEFYEHVWGHPKHLHLLCRKCGCLCEADSDELRPLLTKFAKKNGFELKDYTISIQGVCSSCENGAKA